MIDNYLNSIQEKLDIPLPAPDDWNIDIKIPDPSKDFNFDYTNPKVIKWLQGIFGKNRIPMSLKSKEAIAAGAMALLIIAIGVLVYRKFMSKASKACKNYKGDEKNECLKKYREKAKQLKIQTLVKNRKACSKTKNPQKCVEKINKKIRGLKK